MFCRVGQHGQREPDRQSNLQYLSGEARPIDLHPEKVFHSKQLPLTVTVTLHCLKVAPCTLLTHDGALQLLEKDIREIQRFCEGNLFTMTDKKKKNLCEFESMQGKEPLFVSNWCSYLFVNLSEVDDLLHSPQ